MNIDLSFSRFVAARKGSAAARLREGAAYSYSGDLRIREALDRMKPVTLAMEATVRFWNGVGRGRLLGNAIRVSDRQFPRLYGLLARCADTLQIALPELYVSPEVGTLNAHTFGSSERATIVVAGALVDHLTDDELLSVLGHECGHIHNNHTVYLTTLYFLTNAATLFIRWITQPAIVALRSWARRAEITCDRASLLCTRRLEVTTAALVKLAVGSRRLYSDIDVDEYVRQLDELPGEPGRLQELLATHPALPRRVKALRLFAETSYYQSFLRAGSPAVPPVSGDSTPEAPGSAEPGVPPPAAAPPPFSKEACDARVAELLSVLG
jgi:Zn-dependent protease with chaperone function